MMMDREILYDRLKQINEPRGFFFNKDRELVLDLLNGLLINRERYGYMSCPCRLAADDRQRDQDIICPCAYREQDIAEYGSCYCALYVSRAWNEAAGTHPLVPERRPPGKILGISP